jgi:hypothetical protein
MKTKPAQIRGLLRNEWLRETLIIKETAGKQSDPLYRNFRRLISCLMFSSCSSRCSRIILIRVKTRCDAVLCGMPPNDELLLLRSNPARIAVTPRAVIVAQRAMRNTAAGTHVSIGCRPLRRRRKKCRFFEMSGFRSFRKERSQ